MRVRKLLRRFVKDDGAAITVEWLIWIPLYLSVITIIVDSSLMFTSYAGLWDTAHATSRQLSTGQMSLSDGELYGEQRASVFAPNPTVTAGIVGGDKVQVQIAVAASELAPFGFLGFAKTFDIVATTTHFIAADDNSILLGFAPVNTTLPAPTVVATGNSPDPEKKPKKPKKKKSKKH